MAGYKGFPLLVEGSWGPDLPKNLSTKLQLYFQSSKKSGGGKCKVHQEPGSPPCFVVVFLLDDVRQRVLMRDNHELVLPGKRMFKLTLKLLSASEKGQEAAEREIPRDGSRVKGTTKQPERKNGEDPRRCRSGSRITLQGTKTVVTTITKAAGAHNYRNNSLERRKRKDRGEESQGAQKKRKTWSKDASEKLDTTLSVYKTPENVEAVPNQHESLSSSVAFENLKDSVTDMLLTLLVENICCLSCDDFEVEVIRDLDVAVVTFKKYIDVMKFVEKCAKHPKVKQLQLSARVLEVTKTIRTENLPPGVDAHDLKVFFEDPQNGGGRVANVECLPEESSALVEFFDRRALDSIMTKKLELNHMPLSVFPYYHSLDTALYGKEKPLIKLPAPFKETLDLLIWKFLQKNTHLVEEITEEVRQCHCELAWSQLNGEVTFTPSASLVSQGRKKIMSWQKDTSRVFNEVRSKYKVISFKVDPLVWDTMKNALDDNRFLIDFDALMEILNVVGKSEDIQNFEPQVKQLIASTRQRIEREQQSVEEKVSVSPGKYSLLRHSGVLEHLSSECPEVEMSYDEAAQHMCFKGLPADVYRFKCGIQEKTFAMAQKDLQVSPEIFQFLKETDSAEFSKSLFTAQNMLAVYELEAASVLLTSCSPAALLEAEKKMVGALSFKRIDVEDSKVLSDKKWKRLISYLWRKHNSSSKTVLIRESTSESTAEVIVAGCVRDVNEVHDQLSEFLERHTEIERLVEVKSVLVLHYIENKMKLLLQKVKKVNVKVTLDHEHNPNGFSLIGPKTEVLKVVELVTKARDSVCVRKIQIDKPGAKQFFQGNQQFYRNKVEKLFGCSVELVEDESKADSSSDGQKFFFSSTLPSGVSLIVQQGDLTQFPVDVVVNAANEDLKHGGGLAAALLKAAGPEIQEYCDQIVKAKGKMPPGSATISKAGRLPYHHMIHAVGPQWNQNEAHNCEGLLKQAVKESLCLAEKYWYSSIAIPAICSGDHGFPLPQCVETIVLAVKEHFHQKSDGHTLKEIYLVDAAEKTVEAFAEAVKKLLKGSQRDSASPPSLPVTKQSHVGRDDGNRESLLTPKGLRVLLVRGDVQNAVTDVVVNSIPSDLALNRGPIAQALLNKAGPELQEELNTVGRAVTVHEGSIFLTSGYNLHCSHVLHVVGPDWSKNSTSACQIMKTIIRECLNITLCLNIKSITFPAIGTGTLGFPKQIFAKLIISELFQFSSYSDLEEVHLMLHPGDHENIQAFSDEFAKWTDGNFSSEENFQIEDSQEFCGALFSPRMNAYEMKIGSITYQVALGNIIHEVADVIVNSTSKTFNHKAGVSKAILEGAGKHVEMQCFSKVLLQGSSDYIVTDGGSLKCKNIIHVIGDNDVKKSVTSVLQECEQRNHSSVCLPAIGTGRAKQNPEKVAEAIMDALQDFDQKGPMQPVRTVKVVIFTPELLKVFYNQMKKREVCLDFCHQSVILKTSSFQRPLSQCPKKQNPLVLEEKKESILFLVCGEKAEDVEDALYYLQYEINSNQRTYTTEDECIKDLDESEYQQLNQLQKNLNIAIALDTKTPSIKVLGFEDVTQAENKIEEMIKSKKVSAAKEQEVRADCTSELIEWQYGSDHTFHSFDKITNLLLEEARRANKKAIKVKINHQIYEVDLNTCTATGAQGDTFQVKRLTKSDVGIPAHWSDMGQQKVLVVPLQPTDTEYIAVARKFHKTCEDFTIQKIERIQNPDLWISYQTQKRAMDAKNGQIANERKLFHGTDANSVPYINTNGFNRSYAGKNATVCGKGTYFAVKASYSANDKYSRPHLNGEKQMYYVRVLTGMYSHGHESLLEPPPKNPQNPTDLYDTVTDNVQKPKLFVVFHDYQSYPEYLITFRK